MAILHYATQYFVTKNDYRVCSMITEEGHIL